MTCSFIRLAFLALLGKRKKEQSLKQVWRLPVNYQAITNFLYSMNTTHEDVCRAVQSWSLEKVVSIKQIGGRTLIEHEGASHSYPHWLAVLKVNQIGAAHCSLPTAVHQSELLFDLEDPAA